MRINACALFFCTTHTKKQLGKNTYTKTMASLQTLRDKGGIIVSVVIGFSLVAFVLGDVLSSGGSIFSSNTDVVEVNGKSISAQEYQTEVAVLNEVYKIRGGAPATQLQQRISQEALQNLIVRYGVEPQLNKIGVSIGVEELTNLLVGNQPAPIIREFFSDPQTGNFNPEYVRNFVANVNQDQTGGMQLVWNDIQENVLEQAQLMKYKALVDRGAYVTEQQANFYAELGATTYTVKYIAQNTNDIADELIEITEQQITEFYNTNTARFQQEQSRTINYVTFDIIPSEEDYQAAEEYIETLAQDFENNQTPKLFAQSYSEEQYDEKYYKKDQLSTELATFAFATNNNNKVYAPEMVNDQYILYKIADRKTIPDSVEFSYIMMEPTQKTTADSLLKALRRPNANFANAAAKHSADPTNANNGGQTGTMDPQTLPQELFDPIIEMNRNETKLIELPNALFIVKMHNKKGINPKVQLAKIVYRVDPSDKTRTEARQKAVEFAAKAQNKGFANTVSEDVMMARTEVLYPYTHAMQAHTDSREMVRWAYNAKLGELSDIQEYGDTYIVATLNKITQEGIQPLAEVKEMVETILTNEAKIAAAAQKLNGTTVDQIALTLDAEIQEEGNVNFLTNSYSVSMYDPAFAGSVAALTKGETSKPIKGNQAAYLVEVTETTSTPQSPLMIKEKILAEQNQYMFQGVYKSLIDGLEVSDNRYKFF